MAKLGTQFQPIVNPANTRLLTLIDETTGLRYKINIADFFAVVASGAEFTGAVKLTGGVTGDTTFAGDTTIDSGAGSGGTSKLSVKRNTIPQSINLEQRGALSVLNIETTNSDNPPAFQILQNANLVSDRIVLAIDSAGVATFSGTVLAQGNNLTVGNPTAGNSSLDVTRSETSFQVASFNASGGTATNGLFLSHTTQGTASQFFIRCDAGGTSELFKVDHLGGITSKNLAGTGTRNVVVDANGKMSAP